MDLCINLQAVIRYNIVPGGNPTTSKITSTNAVEHVLEYVDRWDYLPPYLPGYITYLQPTRYLPYIGT